MLGESPTKEGAPLRNSSVVDGPEGSGMSNISLSIATTPVDHTEQPLLRTAGHDGNQLESSVVVLPSCENDFFFPN